MKSFSLGVLLLLLIPGILARSQGLRMQQDAASLISHNAISACDSAALTALSFSLRGDDAVEEGTRERWKPFHVGEMILQSWTSVASFVVMGYVGAGLGAMIIRPVAERSLGLLSVGYAFGAGIGIPLGIEIIGHAMGGRGGFLAALGGSLASVGLTFAVWDSLPEGDAYTTSLAGLAAVNLFLPLVCWHLAAEPEPLPKYSWPGSSAAAVRSIHANSPSARFDAAGITAASCSPAGFSIPANDAAAPRTDFQLTLLQVSF